ncbi:hypothetical protein VaNZ11_014606 [Volvox africanus]|uniref:DNA-directed RNA polymerase n=1 Tax=Volvox africanus TaxID=51714 RepID=A0ABQ5SKE7_9CHLO|nr:hypothetical protein VaNZ11_014606 [Volvox africanus]
MSRPSLFASALFANPTSQGGLTAVSSGASSLSSSRPFLPQLAETICNLTFQQLKFSAKGSTGILPGARCHSTAAAGQTRGPSLDHASTPGRSSNGCATPAFFPEVAAETNGTTMLWGCSTSTADGAGGSPRVSRRIAGCWEPSKKRIVKSRSVIMASNTGAAFSTGSGTSNGRSGCSTSCSAAGLASKPGHADARALWHHCASGGGINSFISTFGSCSVGNSSTSIRVACARPESRSRRRLLQTLSGGLWSAAAPQTGAMGANTLGSRLAPFSSQAAVRAQEAAASARPSPPQPPPPHPLSLPTVLTPPPLVQTRRTRRCGNDGPDATAAAAAAAAPSISQSTVPPANCQPSANNASSTVPKRRGRPRKVPSPAAAATAAAAHPSSPGPSTPSPAGPDANLNAPSPVSMHHTADVQPAFTCTGTGMEWNSLKDDLVIINAPPTAAEQQQQQQQQQQQAPELSDGGAGPGADHGPLPSGGYLELPDAGQAYYSSAGFVGDLNLWHQQHVDEIFSVPARGPAIPTPSLEKFERQINVEIQARHLALEEYRRELDKQKARGALDESKGVRRLLDSWIPILTEHIEQHMQQFLDLDGSWRSIRGARNKVAMSKSDRARARTVGVPNADQAVVKLEQQRAKEAGEIGGSGSSGRDSEAAAAAPLMRELTDWVPYVLPVPPQVLARTVLSGLLNHTALRSYENTMDLPPGMAKSVDVAEHIGERLVHTVSYMKICEAISRRRKELFAEGRRLREVKIAAAKMADRKAVAAAAAGPAEGEAQGGGGSSGKDDGGGRGNLDSQILEAAARVRAARKALEGLKAAAAAVQPRSAARELAGVSAVKAGGGGDASQYKNSRTRQLNRLASDVPGLAFGMDEWTLEARVKVGAGLLALAVAAMRVRVPDSGAEEPAFNHTTNALMTFERGGYQTPGFIICHPQVLRMLEGDEELRRLLHPRVLPMLVEPRPWRNLRGGGLLTTTVPIVKTRDSPLLLSRLREAHRKGQMQHLYDALTVLGNVPWRVNSRVFAVMEQVINSGGGQLGVPFLHNHEMPPRFTTHFNDRIRAYLGDTTPEQCGTPYMRLQREGFRSGQLLVGSGALSPAEEETYQRECNDVRMANRNESGQRTVLKYRIETARQLVGSYDLYDRPGGGTADGGAPAGSSGELSSLLLPSFDLSGSEPTVFFQPHNVDFRGRAYPLHPFLNHLGDDNTRSLLQFGVGKPLGTKGFRWLLMQVANFWGKGVDKLPLAQRQAWAEERMPAVRASAAAPLDSNWWRGGERPWQLLATCFEVAAALESGSNPASYISHQPVLQDGTCNGLQHYAALARDSGCGAAVNLLPADRPQDVYQAVANVVADRVARDRQRGRSEAAKVYGSVDRKLVKQTVMTYVYGVTIVGAREQIENRLEERGWTNARERRKVATYLARITFESMGEVFGPVVAVRGWLDDCAKHAVSSGHPVCWTSPLGFPIEQPYRKLRTFQVWTPLQKITLRDFRNEEAAPLDARRQRNGFPPNYIHSLDSAHMMMTAMRVRQAGAAFAAVHDSFWTHAADVEDMNRIIRDTFVELHSRPLLQELYQEVSTNQLYKSAGSPLPPLPPTGNLDLEPIQDSLYFFS